MKSRPILFSAPMVRALLAGTKTETRRVVKPQPSAKTRRFFKTLPLDREGFSIDGPITCPYGQPGDRLIVRETWRYCGWTEDGLPWVEYRADGALRLCERGIPYEWSEKLVDIWADLSAPQNFELEGRAADRRWRPSIHMPRWASRMTLEITGVRVERLQSISEADAQAEGIERVGGEFSCTPWRNYRIGCPDEMKSHCAARSRSYMTLWESINGPGSWDANPWVWVVSFKRNGGEG